MLVHVHPPARRRRVGVGAIPCSERNLSGHHTNTKWRWREKHRVARREACVGPFDPAISLWRYGASHRTCRGRAYRSGWRYGDLGIWAIRRRGVVISEGACSERLAPGRIPVRCIKDEEGRDPTVLSLHSPGPDFKTLHRALRAWVGAAAVVRRRRRGLALVYSTHIHLARQSIPILACPSLSPKLRIGMSY